MESEAGAAWRREGREMCGSGAKNRNHRAKNSLRERQREKERERESVAEHQDWCVCQQDWSAHPRPLF